MDARSNPFQVIKEINEVPSSHLTSVMPLIGNILISIVLCSEAARENLSNCLQSQSYTGLNARRLRTASTCSYFSSDSCASASRCAVLITFLISLPFRRSVAMVVQLVLCEPTVLAHELSPDLAPGSRVQLRITQRHMDAGLKRRIDMIRAVGSEEQNTLHHDGQFPPTSSEGIHTS